MQALGQKPDLSGLSPEERQSIERACTSDKDLKGPAAYYRCLKGQLSQLGQRSRGPDLSGLSPEERQSIERACTSDKDFKGTAAYDECLRKQQALLNQPIKDTEPPPLYAPKPTPPKPSTKPQPYHEVIKPAPNLALPQWRSGLLETSPKSISDMELEPDRLCNEAAPSVYILLAARSRQDLLRGKVAQRPAVAVSRSRLITNCHLVMDRPFVVIIQKDSTYEAQIEMADPNTDRCVLKIKEDKLNPIKGMRAGNSLRVGEKVYSIGAPSGLEQRFGEGIISGLREFKGISLVQTTAQIPPGSSGGGLFDNRGNLIGIPTFLLRESQTLNFVILAEMYWK